MIHLPTFKLERELAEQGFDLVAGVDEAGTGALAGPVVAAAAVLPINSRLGLVRDSKLLSASQRENLLLELIKKVVGYGIGEVSITEINELGLRKATYLAMRRACQELVKTTNISFVLVDAWTIPELNFPQKAIIHGDRLVKSIAAASIIAKTHRDSLMKKLDKEFPEYGFAKHKGYGTKEHLKNLQIHGACAIHRLNFAPVREVSSADKWVGW